MVAVLRAAGCVFAEEEAALLHQAAPDPADLAGLLARRIAGEPLEHVVGWVDFEGQRIALSRGVFVPRQRTRLLAREAAVALSGHLDPVFVELCCGAAAVSVLVARAHPGALVHACDIDPVACDCARANLPATAAVGCGDLFAPLPHSLRGRVSVLAANAPYVPTDAIALMPAEARLFEPRRALDGGPDGVAVHRRIAAEASDWLQPGGRVLIECGRAQSALTVAALASADLQAWVVQDDDLDATLAVGRLSSSTGLAAVHSADRHSS